VRPTVEEPTENVQPKEHTTTTPSLSELATAYGRATIEHAYARERRENIERDPSASDEQIAEAIAEESRASTTDRDAFNVLTAVPQAPAATLAPGPMTDAATVAPASIRAPSPISSGACSTAAGSSST